MGVVTELFKAEVKFDRLSRSTSSSSDVVTSSWDESSQSSSESFRRSRDPKRGVLGLGKLKLSGVRGRRLRRRPPIIVANLSFRDKGKGKDDVKGVL